MTRCRAILSPGWWKVPFVVLVSLLSGVPSASAQPSDEPMKPHGGISSVTAFDVRVHLKYRVRETSPKSTHVVDAESDWSGVIPTIPENEDACEWTGQVNVRANVREQSVTRGSHTHTSSVAAQGTDEQNFHLTFYDDGTYEFGFGYAQVPGQQTLQCSAGKCKDGPRGHGLLLPPRRAEASHPEGCHLAERHEGPPVDRFSRPHVHRDMELHSGR